MTHSALASKSEALSGLLEQRVKPPAPALYGVVAVELGQWRSGRRVPVVLPYLLLRVAGRVEQPFDVLVIAPGSLLRTPHTAMAAADRAETGR